MAPEQRPKITIVGAGVAGMAAALRLRQAGCSVTLIEEQATVGGQFGGVSVNGTFHEHAFHIFTDWCENFQDIAHTIGLTEADFDPRPTFLTLRPLDGGRTPEFMPLQHLGSLEYFWTNANSGVADWADMLIYGYSMLDLLSDRSLDREEFLNRVSVNGYMRSQPYATNVAALLHQELLLKVFAVPSYETSARAYQTYLRLGAAFPYPRPPFKVLTANCQDTFWKPFLHFLAMLKAPGTFELRCGQRLTKIFLDETQRKVTQIEVAHLDDHGQTTTRTRERVEQLIVAIPPERLYRLVTENEQLRAQVPELLDLRHLRSQQVAVLDLAFKRDLKVPREHVTLLDHLDRVLDEETLDARNGMASEYGLSFVDQSQLWRTTESWTNVGTTFLSVIAADVSALSGLGDDEAQERIIEVLRRYLGFDVRDLDRNRTHFQSHKSAPLFINTVGSWQYRPEARLDDDGRLRGRLQKKVGNLYLAGDYCRSRIDIVSVEGAIHTGICAAKAVYPQVRGPILPKPLDPDDWHKIEEGKKMLESWLNLATRRSRITSRTRADRRADGAQAEFVGRRHGLAGGS